MKPRALVVEDDPIIMPTVKSLMASLKHRYVWVTNQGDARDLLQREDFDYVLLDLQIPALPDCSVSEIQYGVDLLHEIRELKAGQMPVVVMTSHVDACVDMAAELFEAGASRTIGKPLLNKGDKFTKIIREALAGRSGRDRGNGRRSASAATPRPFSGGELVFFDDRVELLGVKIITDRGTGQSLMVLRELSRKDANGRPVRLSAEDLADRIDAPGGTATITTCIHTLRTNASHRLRKQGIAVGSEDVIGHDEQGYYLRDWIRVRGGEDIRTPAESSAGDFTAEPSAELNDRQLWILAEIERGVHVRRPMVEKRFGVVAKTAQRDLTQLANRGRIGYVRIGRSGYYQPVANRTLLHDAST